MVWQIPQQNVEGRAFMAVIVTFTVLDLLCLSMRFYSRHINGNNFRQATDYVLTLGFALILGLNVISYAVFSHGYGMTTAEFTSEDLDISSKLFAASEIVWNAATTSIRISLIMLYIQLFSPLRAFRIICRIMITFNLLSFCSIFLASLLICRPLSNVYDEAAGATCGDTKAFETFTAAISFILDAAAAVLPLPMIWMLQLPKSKKVGMTLILSLGFLLCALTLFRLIASYVLQPGDLPRQSAVIMFITALEPVIGFWIPCLPFLPGVINHWRSTKPIANLKHRLSASTAYKIESTPDLAEGDEIELALRSDSPTSHHDMYHQHRSISKCDGRNGPFGRSAHVTAEPRDIWYGNGDGIHVRKDFSIAELPAK